MADGLLETKASRKAEPTEQRHTCKTPAMNSHGYYGDYNEHRRSVGDLFRCPECRTFLQVKDVSGDSWATILKWKTVPWWRSLKLRRKYGP